MIRIKLSRDVRKAIVDDLRPQLKAAVAEMIKRDPDPRMACFLWSHLLRQDPVTDIYNDLLHNALPEEWQLSVYQSGKWPRLTKKMAARVRAMTGEKEK